jgi:hypothetical protein
MPAEGGLSPARTPRFQKAERAVVPVTRVIGMGQAGGCELLFEQSSR